MDTNNTINSTYTPPGSTTACPVPQTCGSRLPCGLCLITNQRCPMMPCQPNIVWTSNTTDPFHDVYSNGKTSTNTEVK